jgi:hypothetical protein
VRPVPTAGTFQCFPALYARRQVPMKIMHDKAGARVEWTIPEKDLDIEVLLPLFFDGLRNYDKIDEPAYRDLARQGIISVCQVAKKRPGFSLVTILSKVIGPIRSALNTRDPSVISVTLRSIQVLCKAESNVGRCLIPFYKTILPVINIFASKRTNTGDGIDYAQRTNSGAPRRTLKSGLNARSSAKTGDNGHDINAIAVQTLEVMEQTGGAEVSPFSRSLDCAFA